MKLKLLAVLAMAGLCAGSLAIAGNGMKTLADDTTNSASQPAMGGPDNAGSTTDNSTNNGTDSSSDSSSSDSSMPPSSDDTSTDTGTGDDDY